MRDWRNRQTRAFKGRVGDRVGSSPTSRTTNGNTTVLPFFYCMCVFCLPANLANKVGRNTPLRFVAFASLRSAHLTSLGQAHISQFNAYYNANVFL